MERIKRVREKLGAAGFEQTCCRREAEIVQVLMENLVEARVAQQQFETGKLEEKRCLRQKRGW